MNTFSNWKQLEAINCRRLLEAIHCRGGNLLLQVTTTLVKEPPSGDEWLHELKFDGYRHALQD